MKSLQSFCRFALLSGLISGTSCFADWPGFLGPGGNSMASKDTLPIDFAPAKEGQASKNIAWRTPLVGRSVSGPIVVGDKVFTTSSSGMEGRWLHVYAVDAKSGEVVWERTSQATGRPYCHPTSANAAPTPCSDGKHVVAFFSSNDLLCYDLQGNLLWCRGLTSDHPQAANDVGMSSSPIIVGGTVVVTIECQADSFATGIDLATGKTKWELSRPRKANWSSPRWIQGEDGSQAIVLHGLDDMVGIDPNTGSQLWRIESRYSSIATAVFSQGKLYAPGSGTKVYQVKSAKEQPQVAWENNKVNPSSSSLLVSPVGVLGLKGTVLACGDDQGNVKWQTRLPEAGQFWATPVIAGDYLYAFAMDGKCFTVKLGEKVEVVATSELGEGVLGSPAIANNAMYVRSVDGLWKISQ